MAVHYSIDSLAVREGRAFGWGWALSEREVVRRVEIRVPVLGQGDAVLQCLPGGARQDLAEAFPTVAHAARSGFTIQGRIPESLQDETATLVMYLEDGSREVRELRGFPAAFVRRTQQPEIFRSTPSNAFRYIRRNGFMAFLVRLGRLLAGLLPPLALPEAPQVHDASRPSVMVVLDHAMGGGANRYREELVVREIGHGRRVAVVSPSLTSLTYTYRERSADEDFTMEFSSFSDVTGYLSGRIISELLLNDLVSFDDPLAILRWARGQKEEGVRLRSCLHDYFAACPSWSLVDDTGVYCHLPDLERCRACLVANTIPFLGYYPDVDVATWRDEWRRMLEVCDEIVAFSQASTDILLAAHPGLEPARISIRPHQVSYLTDRTARPTLTVPVTIGLIGHIGANKGANVIQRMVSHIRQNDLPMRFKVFGSIENVASSEIVDITGPYEAVNLPQLLESHGVAICMLPSVCPETFSYVTSEIMHFGMPLAVFDLGAPAERARNYEFGRVLSTMEPEGAIQQLFDFYDEIVERLGVSG